MCVPAMGVDRAVGPLNWDSETSPTTAKVRSPRRRQMPQRAHRIPSPEASPDRAPAHDLGERGVDVTRRNLAGGRLAGVVADDRE